MRIVIIGAGRLATNIAYAWQHEGHLIEQIYSHTMASASFLADRLGAKATNCLDEVIGDADAYVVAVKDNVLSQVAGQVCKGRERAVFLHTAGSMPMSIFQDTAQHYGVLYPMQTFSKGRLVDFHRVPIFIESNDGQSRSVVMELAHSISDDVHELTSDERRYLHLAAVFACNFANHCYALSAEVLHRCGLPFSVMYPLIEETCQKVHTLSPRDAQTGPAVRYDNNVINAQLQLLDSFPQARRIYEEMSRSIHLSYTQHD